ncbi:MAG: UxaA family hydrolase [Promethearchaeota archaeon]
MPKNAIVLHMDDNVATVLEKIKEGTKLLIEISPKNLQSIIALTKIKFLHKIAIMDIPKGTAVIKYGQIIGRATTDIKKGEHVHTKNVKSWFYS